MYTSAKPYFYGTGRRKSSIARVRLYPGNGNIINGPAIVEQMDSTTVILANQYAVVDKYLNMIIERRPKGGDDNE